LIIFYINQAFSHKEPPKTVVTHFREINDVMINKLKVAITEADWSNTLNSTDVESASNHFITNLKACYDKHLPLKPEL
jgi:hypothetical protein